MRTPRIRPFGLAGLFLLASPSIATELPSRSTVEVTEAVLSLPYKATSPLEIPGAPQDENPRQRGPQLVTALLAPRIGVEPVSLSVTLPVGSHDTRTLTLSNTGDSALDFSLRVFRRSRGGACDFGRGLVLGFDSGLLSSADLNNGLASTIVSGLRGPNLGIALDPDGTYAYVSASNAGAVNRVNLSTGVVSTVVSGLSFPTGLAINASGTRVFVVDQRYETLWSIRVTDGLASAVTNALYHPIGLALGADETVAYVTGYDDGSLSAVDLSTGAVRIVASGMTRPWAVTLDSSGTTAYVTERGTPVFQGPPSGRLLSIDLPTGRITPIVAGLSFPSGVMLDALENRAYVTEYESDSIAWVDLETGEPIRLGGRLRTADGITALARGDCARFLSVDPMNGSIPPGGSLDLDVDVRAVDLLEGNYVADIAIASNDPAHPTVSVSVTLAVAGAPNIVVSGPSVTIESSADLGDSEARTLHELAITVPPVGGGTLEVLSEGFYRIGGSTTVESEGRFLGWVPTANCSELAVGSFPLTPHRLEALSADGVVHVDVENSYSGRSFCGVPRHTVRLTYETAAETLDFGRVFIGQSGEASIRISNKGTGALRIGSITSDRPEFTPSTSVLVVEPGASRSVATQFTPSGAGAMRATLTLLSNDPVSPVISVGLVGNGFDPPVASLTPLSIEGTVREGRTKIQPLRLANSGNSPLEFSLRIAAFSTDPAPGTNGAIRSNARRGRMLQGGAGATAILAPPSPGGSALLPPLPKEVRAREGNYAVSSTSRPHPDMPLPSGSVASTSAVSVATEASSAAATPLVPSPSGRAVGSSSAPHDALGGSESTDPSDTYSTGSVQPHGFPDDPMEVPPPAGVGGTTKGFELLPSSPAAVTSVVEDPASHVLYARATRNHFYRYDAIRNTWTSLATLPELFFWDDYSSAALLNGKIYVAVPGHDQLGVYDIAGNSWSLTSNPTGAGNITTDGEFLFLAGGTFVRFDPVTSIATTLASPPFWFGELGGLRYFDGFIYGHQGYEETGFARYEIATDRWTLLPSIPNERGADLGAAIDPGNREYVTHGPWGTSLYRYSIDSGSWSTSIMPFTAGDGGLGWLAKPVPAVYFVQGFGRRLARSVKGPTFVTVEPRAGSIPAHGSLDLQVLFDGTAVPAGRYEAGIEIFTNDPLLPHRLTSAVLNLAAAPVMEVTGPDVALESTVPYLEEHARTVHSFPLTMVPARGATLEVIANGDFDESEEERAYVSAEGIPLGFIEGGDAYCLPKSKTFPLERDLLQFLAGDGTVMIEVQNTWEVDASCGGDSHTVRFVYPGPADRLDFGRVFLGEVRDLSLTIRNLGSENLEVGSLTSDTPEFSISAPSLIVPAHSVRVVTVRFTPSGEGIFHGVLSLTSNDTDSSVLHADLEGQGLAAPEVSVDPRVLTDDLVSGQTAVHDLRIENRGGSDLEFEVSVENPSAAVTPTDEPTLRIGTPGAGTPDPPTVLIVEDTDPWGSSANQDFLAARGIAYDLIPCSALSTTPLSFYKVVIVPSNQSSCCYSMIAAESTKIEAFVAEGGTLEFHASAGDEHGDVSLVTLPGGMHIEQWQASSNLVLDPTHPLVAGLPAWIEGGDVSASFSAFSEIPANAARIIAVPEGPPTLVVYRYGRGTVVASGQSLEYRSKRSGPAWVILQNMIPYVRALKTSWLAVEPRAGRVPPGGSAVLTATSGATHAGEGDYDAAIRIRTNDPRETEIVVPSHLRVTDAPPPNVADPSAIEETLVAGTSSVRTLSIGNGGDGPLDFYVEVSGSAGPGPAGSSPDEASLERVLQGLNLSYRSVTAAIPYRFDFSEGCSGFGINDGRNDMYDYGNLLSTNLLDRIEYSCGAISSSAAFGGPGLYFTKKYTGLFVLAADLEGVDSFTISGNLGADGGGDVEGSVLETELDGVHYRGFLKSVFSAGDPSVNHLVIVRDAPESTHVFSSNTDDDYHQVLNLSASRRIYYLLYAGAHGAYIDSEGALAVMNAFLRVPPRWLAVTPASASAPGHDSASLSLSFDASILAVGDYTSKVVVRSNDPDTPALEVPVTLHVVQDVGLVPEAASESDLRRVPPPIRR